MTLAAKLAFFLACFTGAASLRSAQNAPGGQGATPSTQANAANTQHSKAQPEQTHEFDPMRATHDVEVGKFYMKRGDLAGAIARFKDAIRYKPHYAEARLLLGESYEKNNDPRRAVNYYRQYLEILPNAAESRKVKERIAALQEKMAKGKAASSPKNP